jgi:D-alanyl-D-alanine dipeptidase
MTIIHNTHLKPVLGRAILAWLLCLALLLAGCTNSPTVSPLTPTGTVDTAAWSGLLGKYAPEKGPNFYLREASGRLEMLLQLEHPSASEEMLYFNSIFYAALPLQPLGTDRFQLPPVNPLGATEIAFDRGAGGPAISAKAGNFTFNRRFFPPEERKTFRIPLQRPLEELRAETLTTSPPVESGDFLKPELVEVRALYPSIRLDNRYATKDNFMGAPFYNQSRAYLQRPAAEALVRVQKALEPFGFALVVYDAYRPWYITKMFWDATPPELRNFVADPAKGSRHNRGAAVDVSLIDLKTNLPEDMGSGYDEFSERALVDYPGSTTETRWQRELLAFLMMQEGFQRMSEEWWHFDYKDYSHYPILNLTFEQLQATTL